MGIERTELEKRQYYKNVAERSFKTVFDQYMFYKFSRGLQEEISANDFKAFSVEQSLIDEYVNEYWQKEYKFKKKGKYKWKITIKEIETNIYNWEKEKNNEKITKECESNYINNRFTQIYPYEKFCELLQVKMCYYCDITEEQILKLISKHNIFKKKTTRGWTLEIDRKKPNLEYTEENCVRCCYWCNSAKTDEFDDIEFIPVGEAIKKIWNDRLKS